ncbi:MAG: class I SAM-dependent methyltransferase [Dehalococcoidia bacterium]|nr:MAG: class I SAM-dependent methyltransferase [Dehalococcoidia bacterium]
MSRKSIRAYDLPERVAAYDTDMELMHPNRSKMVQVALEVLPFHSDARLRALDLGVGTGYFAERFLEAFPQSSVHALDGARTMIDLAKARLGSRGKSVDFRVGDMRDLREHFAHVESFDVVYSSYALHHLTLDEKMSVVRAAVSLLRPGGWFVNADIVVADTSGVEKRIQEIRVNGIVERARGADPRFADYEATRRFLDELEANEGDQPLTLKDDLQVLREAGLGDVAVYWLEYREAVTGGRK